MAEPEPRLAPPGAGYETSDWPLAAIGILALVVLAFLVIAPLVLRAAYRDTLADADRRLLVEPPAPRLQSDPAADLARFRTAEQQRLESYGWVDRQKGIVHIPIGQAMREIAERGIDGFPRGKP